MKTVIFSDVHLGTEFDQKICTNLSSIIKSADKVIINGDFWDRRKTTFGEFIESEWKQLFPLLKKKQTVYLFGNHDRQSWVDERVNTFSELQAVEYLFTSGEKRFLVTHGNQYSITDVTDDILPFFMIYLFWFVFDLFEEVGFWLFGDKIYWFTRPVNRKMIRQSRSILKKDMYLVCGHSHRQTYDQVNRYINTGVIKKNLFQYLHIDSGEIKLISREI